MYECNLKSVENIILIWAVEVNLKKLENMALCKLCDKAFDTHVKACKQGLGLKCDICGKCVISERNLKSHFTLAHPNIEDLVKVPETDENESNPNEFIEKSQCYKCTKCNYISLTKSGM